MHIVRHTLSLHPRLLCSTQNDSLEIDFRLTQFLVAYMLRGVAYCRIIIFFHVSSYEHFLRVWPSSIIFLVIQLLILKIRKHKASVPIRLRNQNTSSLINNEVRIRIYTLYWKFLVKNHCCFKFFLNVHHHSIILSIIYYA